jgi:hypothetical protein
MRVNQAFLREKKRKYYEVKQQERISRSFSKRRRVVISLVDYFCLDEKILKEFKMKRSALFVWRVRGDSVFASLARSLI